MKKASTTQTVRQPLSLTERKSRAARRMRNYREKNPGKIESRVTDRMIVEALALHLERIPRPEARDLLTAIHGLVVDGLVHRGHDRSDAVEAFDRRVRGLVDGGENVAVTSFVRMAAKERSLGREPGGFFRRTL